MQRFEGNDAFYVFTRQMMEYVLGPLDRQPKACSHPAIDNLIFINLAIVKSIIVYYCESDPAVQREDRMPQVAEIGARKNAKHSEEH